MPAADPVTGLLDIGGKLIDRLWPNPEERDKAKLKLLRMQQKGELAALAAETQLLAGQQEINKIEAASTNLFISGWRPFVGWVCGCAFAYAAILEPLMTWTAKLCGSTFTPPVIDTNITMQVLLGLLGLGTMRSWEKIRGAAAVEPSAQRLTAKPPAVGPK